MLIHKFDNLEKKEKKRKDKFAIWLYMRVGIFQP